jgi:hypothetical protein
MAATLARLAVELDGVDGAAVVEGGGDEPEVAGFSTEDYRHLTDLQIDEPGGPAVEAMRTGRAAVLVRRQGDAARWLVLQPTADELGVRYVYALPLRRHRDTLGSLVLFGADLGDLGALERRELETLAQVAGVGLAQRRLVRAADERAEQLQGALSTRVVIEQAKGVLLAQGCADLDAAFETLRDDARAHRRRLEDVARAVVAAATSRAGSPVLPQQRRDEPAASSGPDAPSDRAGGKPPRPGRT